MYGWMKISDSLVGDIDFNILRFENEKNPEDPNYPQIFTSLFGLTFSNTKKVGRMTFFIAKNDKDIQPIVLY